MKTSHCIQGATLLSITLIIIAMGTRDVTAANLSWRSTTLAASSGNNVAVTVHPDGSFLAVDGFHVRRSINAGTNWTTVSDFAAFAGGAIAIDPSDPSILYSGRSHGLLKSANGGTNWFALADLNAGAAARSIAVSPSEPTTVFAGVSGGWGVYKSMNRGGTWINLLTSRSVQAIAVHPQNPLVVLTGTVGYYSTEGGLLQSVDGGTNWANRLPGKDVTAVVYASGPSAPAFAGTAADGIFSSTDGGQSWTQLSGTPAFGPVSALVIHPTSPQSVFAAIQAGGVFASHDGGVTWTSQNAGLSDLNVVSLSIRTTAPFTLLAGTYGGKAFWANPEIPSLPPSPPTLSLALYAGITISGQVGRRYQIDYADRLDITPGHTNWHVLTMNLFLPTPNYLFIDTNTVGLQRFYRAAAMP
jgi:photosystem II stability/assembly factor-like uncharacterized protein